MVAHLSQGRDYTHELLGRMGLEEAPLPRPLGPVPAPSHEVRPCIRHRGARRRGSTTSILGRHRGRVSRRVKRLLQAEWSSVSWGIQRRRWHGARPHEWIAPEDADLVRIVLWQEALHLSWPLGHPLHPKIALRLFEAIWLAWRWDICHEDAIADCIHVHLHWSWPRCCRF